MHFNFLGPQFHDQFCERSLKTKRLAIHVAEIYQWYYGKGTAERMYKEVFAKAGADWMLATFIFDRGVLQGVVGIGKPYAEGDFSPEQTATFEALAPHIIAGFKAAVAYTRAQTYGSVMAKSLEYHPNALFLFDEKRQMVYANHSAKNLMQEEEPGHSNLPMATRSELVRALRKQVEKDADQPLPKGIETRVVPLAEWPGLNVRKPSMVIVRGKRKSGVELTKREVEILTSLRSGKKLPVAAKHLGVTVATLRTHLRKIFRKLGVSGLNEALTLYYLNGG